MHREDQDAESNLWMDALPSYSSGREREGITMDALGGFGVRRVDEAEGGAIVLVEPIGHVFYAVSVLNVDVPAVRLGDVVRLQAAQVVAVHENWHVVSRGRRGGWVTSRGDRNLRPKRL